MKSHLLHYWNRRATIMRNDPSWEDEKVRRMLFEQELREAGYQLAYDNLDYEVSVSVVFRNEEEAAVFKLTYL